MAEYDVDSEIWRYTQIENLDMPILPLSSITYSAEMKIFYVLGGYNNKVNK